MGTAAPASPEADAVTQQNLVKEAAALGLSATETETETEADMPGVASELEEQGADRSPAEDWDEYSPEASSSGDSASDGAAGAGVAAAPALEQEVSPPPVEAATPTQWLLPFTLVFRLQTCTKPWIWCARWILPELPVATCGNVCFTNSLPPAQLPCTRTATARPLRNFCRRGCHCGPASACTQHKQYKEIAQRHRPHAGSGTGRTGLHPDARSPPRPAIQQVPGPPDRARCGFHQAWR